MPIWDNRVRVSVLSVAERFRMDNRTGYVPPIKWFARKPLFLCQETVRYLVDRFGVQSVADIFSGSGTIPLACILQGIDVEAFDLNPVACSITEAVVRILPKYGDDIVLDVARVLRAALKDFRYRMSRYYSAGNRRSTVYLYCFTAPCLLCGGRTPISKYWGFRTTKSGEFRFVRPEWNGSGFVLVKGSGDITGNLVNGRVTCLVCGGQFDVNDLREKSYMTGGSILFDFMLGVTDDDGSFFDPPTGDDLSNFVAAAEDVWDRRRESFGGVPALPEEVVVSDAARVRVAVWGRMRWNDLFNPRQALFACELMRSVRQELDDLERRRGPEYAADVGLLASMWVGSMVRRNSRLSRPVIDGKFDIVPIGAIHNLNMTWFYSELAPGSSFVTYSQFIGNLHRLASRVEGSRARSRVHMADSCSPGGLGIRVDAVVTDPPYSDYVPYSALSEVAYQVMRRVVGDRRPDLMRRENVLWDAEVGSKDSTIKQSLVYAQSLSASMVNAANSSNWVVYMFANRNTAPWAAFIASASYACLNVVNADVAYSEHVTSVHARAGETVRCTHVIVMSRNYRPEPVDVVGALMDYFKTGIVACDLVTAAIPLALIGVDLTTWRFDMASKFSDLESKFREACRFIEGVLSGDVVRFARVLADEVGDETVSRIVSGLGSGEMDPSDALGILCGGGFADGTVAGDVASLVRIFEKRKSRSNEGTLNFVSVRDVESAFRSLKNDLYKVVAAMQAIYAAGFWIKPNSRLVSVLGAALWGAARTILHGKVASLWAAGHHRPGLVEGPWASGSKDSVFTWEWR